MLKYNTASTGPIFAQLTTLSDIKYGTGRAEIQLSVSVNCECRWASFQDHECSTTFCSLLYGIVLKSEQQFNQGYWVTDVAFF